MIIRVTNLRREFTVGVETIRALAGVDLSIERGEMVAIMGSSGSGKSTAADLIMGLIKPKRGKIEIDGINLHNNKLLPSEIEPLTF